MAADNVTITGGTYAATDYAADGTRNGAPEWKSGSNYIGVYLDWSDFRYHFFAGPFSSDPDSGFDSFLRSVDPCDDEFNTIETFVPGGGFGEAADWEVVDNGSPPTNLTELRLTADDANGYVAAGASYDGANVPYAWFERRNSRAAWNATDSSHHLAWSGTQWEHRTGVTYGSGTLLAHNTTDQDALPTSGWVDDVGGGTPATFTAGDYAARSIQVPIIGFYQQPRTTISPYDEFEGNAMKVMDSTKYSPGRALWCGNDEGRITGATNLFNDETDCTIAFPVFGRSGGRGTFSMYTAGTTRVDLRIEWVMTGVLSLKVTAYDGAGNTSSSPAQIPVSNRWMWIGLTKEGTQLIPFINGVQFGAGIDAVGVDFTSMDDWVMGGTWNTGTESIDSDIQGGVGPILVWRGTVLTASQLRTIAKGGMIAGADYVLEDYDGTSPIVPTTGTGNATIVGTVDAMAAGPTYGTSAIETQEAQGVIARAYVDPDEPGSEAPFIRSQGYIFADAAGALEIAVRADLTDSALTAAVLASVETVTIKALARRIDPDTTGTNNMEVYADKYDGQSGGNYGNYNVTNLDADFSWKTLVTFGTGSTNVLPVSATTPAMAVWLKNNNHQIDLQALSVILGFNGYEDVTLNGDGSAPAVPILKIRLTPTDALNYKRGASIRINKGGSTYVGKIIGVYEVAGGAVDIIVGEPDATWATLYSATAIDGDTDGASLSGGTVDIDEETGVATTSIYSFSAGGGSGGSVLPSQGLGNPPRS